MPGRTHSISSLSLSPLSPSLSSFTRYHHTPRRFSALFAITRHATPSDAVATLPSVASSSVSSYAADSAATRCRPFSPQISDSNVPLSPFLSPFSSPTETLDFAFSSRGDPARFWLPSPSRESAGAGRLRACQIRCLSRCAAGNPRSFDKPHEMSESNVYMYIFRQLQCH